MMAASVFFAAVLWVYSMGVLYPSVLLITIGAVFAYVGVIPFALIALLIINEWSFIIPMLILAACFTAARVLMNCALKGAAKELYSHEKDA
jgi:Sec-independent protein secretion pathway component TatC